MLKRLIIFGAGDIAQLAHFYFQNDSDYEVVGFTVDREFVSAPSFCGLPLVAADEVTKTFPPDEHAAFVALSYSKMSSLRAQKYAFMKDAGYKLATYMSSRATVLGVKGVGDNCFILEDNTLQPFVEIGCDVTLWSGNHIGHHAKVGDHSFLASHIVVSGGVEIGTHCFLGVNATLRDHIKIGDRCVIGAGAIILQDAEAEGVYIGPATERSKVPSSRLRKI